MKPNAALSILVVIGPIIGNVGKAAEEKRRPAVERPLVAFSGADSHVRKQSNHLVTTEDEWTRIWVGHLGTTKDDAYRPLFEIDFDRCQIIVIFKGDQVNVRGIKIESLMESRDAIVVRFYELTYQTAGASNEKPPDRPYAFVVVPKTNKTVVLEEGTRTYINEPLTWTEIARLSNDQTIKQQEVKP